jgi:hypothetical protein
MSSQRTDNSRESIKVKIRKEGTKNNMVILDCYHGKGVIWNTIKKQKNIKVIGIEKDKGKGYGSIYGECEKVIPSLDLSKYQIIDFDAWGSPYKSIKAMFLNESLKKGTICFYTFIQTGMGTCQKALLNYIGIKDTMYKKCPTLFRNHGFIAFKEFLRVHGIKEITDYNFIETGSTKHYGMFKI